MKTIKITKHGNREKRTTERRMTMEDVVALVKGESTKKKIETYRERMAHTYHNKREALAKKLDRLLFAVEMKGGEMLGYNGLVLLEVNHLHNVREAAEVKRMVSGYPQTLFAMIGADGQSVKFVVPYTRPDGSLPTEQKQAEIFHAHAYRHAIRTYEPRIPYPIKADDRVLDQYCHISHDTEAYHNAEALAIHIEQPEKMPERNYYREKKAAAETYMTEFETASDRLRRTTFQYEMAVKHAVEEFGNLRDKNDFKPLLITLAQDCFRTGVDEEDCTLWTMIQFGKYLSEPEIRTTIRNTYSIEEGFGEGELYSKEQKQALQLDEFMRRRYDFRRNTMTGCVELRERNSFCFKYRPATLLELNSIALNAHEEGLEVWDRDVKRYVNSDRVPAYSPIEEWLAALPAWDGTDRIRQLARRVPCDNPQWEHLFYIWFLSMVAHWQGRDKDHSNSVSPLLVGGQGCGKSTFCRTLMPEDLRPTYFTDDIDFSKQRDAVLYLTRFALINIDEFDQVSEKHQGFLKHLLQKPSVNVRKHYGTMVEEMKRYASFIATSNHTDLLKDPSGSRRFICVRVTGQIANDQPIDYPQLYAQALDALNHNERYWLTHEEEAEQMEANEEFQEVPIYEDLFHKYFRPASAESEGKQLTATDIYLALQQKSKQRLPQRNIALFGRFLVKVGVKSKKTNHGKLYFVVEKSVLPK